MQQIYPKNGIFIENRTNSPRLQAFAFCVANFYSTVVCKHFEDLKDLIILSMLKKLVFSWLLGFFYLNIVYSFSNSTLQIAMISKAMIKFRSKFQFQILYNFTGQLKKLKLAMVMVKRFDKYLHILVTISFFHNWVSSILNKKVL